MGNSLVLSKAGSRGLANTQGTGTETTDIPGPRTLYRTHLTVPNKPVPLLVRPFLPADLEDLKGWESRLEPVSQDPKVRKV